MSSTTSLFIFSLIIHLSQSAQAPYPNNNYRYPYQQAAKQQVYKNNYPAVKAYQDPNAVTAYDPYRNVHSQTQYPSYPNVNYAPQPTQQCTIPPDLWCDSPQAAQQCGVTRQCDSLKRQNKPLKISLMYEALCPYCQKFISNQLGTIFNQYRGQFELELVPWGNARILRDGSFSCNHGKKECDANRLQSCVIDILKVQGALPFIVCFERALQNNHVESSLHQCSAFVRNQYRQIRHCYDSERGVQLQRMAAHKTMSTRPNAIAEVPYLLINDYTPDTDNNNLNVMILPQLLNKWVKLYRK